MDFFFVSRALGPKRNLFVHHLCSSGRDSVGLDLDDVAKATDFVVDACSVFKFEEVLKVDILINISCLLLVVGLSGIGAKHLPGQEGLVLVCGQKSL